MVGARAREAPSLTARLPGSVNLAKPIRLGCIAAAERLAVGEPGLNAANGWLRLVLDATGCWSGAAGWMDHVLADVPGSGRAGNGVRFRSSSTWYPQRCSRSLPRVCARCRVR